jgi:hypothetical protein
MPTACRREIMLTDGYPRHPHQMTVPLSAQRFWRVDGTTLLGPTSGHGESQSVFDGPHGATGRRDDYVI